MRHAIKDLLRTKGVSKVGLPKVLVKDVNGTLKIPYKGLLGKLSLQVMMIRIMPPNSMLIQYIEFT